MVVKEVVELELTSCKKELILTDFALFELRVLVKKKESVCV